MSLKVIIKGERCSGTNYLYELIKSNIKVEMCGDLGWKHAFINTFNKNVYNHNNYLIIFIFRNPIDWINSLYREPWHFEKKSYNNISEFIRKSPKQKIKGITELQNWDIDSELYWERHPFSLKIANNICQLRNWKNSNFLSATEIFPYVEYITYEELCEDPEKFISNLNQKYFNKNINFENITWYKGDKQQGIYKKKDYSIISPEDITFIREELDLEIENRIGYKTL